MRTEKDVRGKRQTQIIRRKNLSMRSSQMFILQKLRIKNDLDLHGVIFCAIIFIFKMNRVVDDHEAKRVRSLIIQSRIQIWKVLPREAAKKSTYLVALPCLYLEPRKKKIFFYTRP